MFLSTPVLLKFHKQLHTLGLHKPECRQVSCDKLCPGQHGLCYSSFRFVLNRTKNGEEPVNNLITNLT